MLSTTAIEKHRLNSGRSMDATVFSHASALQSMLIEVISTTGTGGVFHREVGTASLPQDVSNVYDEGAATRFLHRLHARKGRTHFI